MNTDLHIAGALAMVDAGFVGVETHQHQELWRSSRVTLTVSGLCPCGLGQSRVAICWTHGRVPPAEALYARLHAAALAHIEHDKAEGRWV